MASAAARKRSRYAQTTHSVYGNLAYAPGLERVPQRGGSEVLRPRPKSRPKERTLVRPKVQVREAGQVSVFAVVGFLAVGIFAVLLMLGSIQLTMVSDEVISLREQLSDLQTEEAKLMAQYELAYDLQEIERQMLASGEMMKVQSWQTYTLELSEPDTVEYHQGSDLAQQIMSFAKNLVSAVKEYF